MVKHEDELTLHMRFAHIDMTKITPEQMTRIEHELSLVTDRMYEFLRMTLAPPMERQCTCH